VNKVTPKTKKRTVEKMLKFILRGRKSKVKPKIRVRLVKHEPMILPKANPYLRFRIDKKEIESSGKEVPTAIIVAPIRDSATPQNLARTEAKLTTQLAE
jgi:hypothetical protein